MNGKKKLLQANQFLKIWVQLKQCDVNHSTFITRFASIAVIGVYITYDKKIKTTRVLLHITIQEYKANSGREDLDFTIKILSHTSKLVKVFLSNKPITCPEDERYNDLNTVLSFFKDCCCTAKEIGSR